MYVWQRQVRSMYGSMRIGSHEAIRTSSWVATGPHRRNRAEHGRKDIGHMAIMVTRGHRDIGKSIMKVMGMVVATEMVMVTEMITVTDKIYPHNCGDFF